MIKSLHKLFISGLLAAGILISCSIDEPVNPFDTLSNDDVLAPLNSSLVNLTTDTAITFQVALPEDIAGQVVSWKWEILNFFGEVLEENAESSFPKLGMPAEEYTIVLTITDASGNTRVFAKDFFVQEADNTDDYQMHSILEANDSGTVGDNITNINNDITVIGLGLPDANVEFLFMLDGQLAIPAIAATTAADGTVQTVVTKAGGLADGIYEVYLKNAAEDKRSRAMYVTIDTKAPTLSWFNNDEALDNNFTVAFADTTIAYSKFKADEGITSKTFTGNYPTAQAAEGFDRLIAGTQTLEITATDLAGNAATPITRTLTVSDPIAPKALLNKGFEDGTGLPNNGYNAAGGDAPNWEIDLNLRYKYNTTHEETALSSSTFDPGTNQFRLTWSNWSKYFFAYVRNGYEEPNTTPPNTNNNIFWFSEPFNAGYDGKNVHSCWYTKVWGTVKQSGFAVTEGVTYRLSAWVMNGTANRPANGATSVKVSGPEAMEFTYTTHSDITEQTGLSVIESISAEGTDVWEQMILTFTPKQSGTIDVMVEKKNAGGNEGCWTHLDNVDFVEHHIPRVN